MDQNSKSIQQKESLSNSQSLETKSRNSWHFLNKKDYINTNYFCYKPEKANIKSPPILQKLRIVHNSIPEKKRGQALMGPSIPRI